MAVNTFGCHDIKNAEASGKSGGVTQANSNIHLSAYEKSTLEEDQTLTEMFSQGTNIQELAVIFERQTDAIKSRLQKFGLLEFEIRSKGSQKLLQKYGYNFICLRYRYE
ncbi:hypothetical protein QUF76_05355 [Desulfobacterales bacterium HSG16]|nr:hypothetical protein [Desulfobacterales bacterium HSG16]